MLVPYSCVTVCLCVRACSYVCLCVDMSVFVCGLGATQCIIMVIDSTDRERLETASTELHKMLANEELRRAFLLIYANKQDVRGALSAAEISERLKLSVVKDHSWHLQPCCALTGEGLLPGMEWITSQLSRS
eukprot:m.36909 g.36909  ORF g.36909 m.36909 type:complete len:132 (+) comp44863_c0_seq1:425-820(+)